MLEHAESKALLVDPNSASLLQKPWRLIPQKSYVIDVADEEYEGEDTRIGQIGYEDWIAQGDTNFEEWHLPTDEWNRSA